MDWLLGAAPASKRGGDGRASSAPFKVQDRLVSQGKLLADGGFAYVYRGKDAETGEKLAIRRVLLQDNDSVAKAKHEIVLLENLLQHPHVVQFHGAEIFGKRSGGAQAASSAEVVFLFELCTGGTLLERLDKAMAAAQRGSGPAVVSGPPCCCPCLPEAEVLDVLSGMAQALTYLCRLGIVHYDVKSENLLMGADGLWKLGDFGSASEVTFDLAGAPRKTLLEAEEFIHGRCTPMYRPPEVCDVYLRWPIGAKVDIFALGCVIFATLTGTHPFPADSACGNIQARYQMPPQASTAYAPAVLKWVRRLLAREPCHRPSAGKLAGEVDRYRALSEEPPDLPPEAAPPEAATAVAAAKAAALAKARAEEASAAVAADFADFANFADFSEAPPPPPAAAEQGDGAAAVAGADGDGVQGQTADAPAE
eukprot:TRINITY_DN23307_c0_g1_i1.p1 TRINITY_DN23307_c0_g1~~TRINITY_DN23307_c0_g1_i1.p1  ORF type:complete len:422 (-),score=109.27 TRINITY_DN23307_c0_g1_i1:145-1410(-)